MTDREHRRHLAWIWRGTLAILGVVLTAWALPQLLLARHSALALVLLFVAVICVVLLVVPAKGKNLIANHGGVGLLAACAVTGLLVSEKGGILLVLFAAVMGAICGMTVGGMRAILHVAPGRQRSHDEVE